MPLNSLQFVVGTVDKKPVDRSSTW